MKGHYNVKDIQIFLSVLVCVPTLTQMSIGNHKIGTC